MENKITHIKIGNTDVFLEDIKENAGKITISDSDGHNYSMQWGAMNGTIQDFILRINDSYFVDKLMGSTRGDVMDVKKTFAELRRYIREDLELPWYKHTAFQKELRERLNYFQAYCTQFEDRHFFVDSFNCSFIDKIDFYTIEDRWERERIEGEFQGIDEVWYFCVMKESPQSIWLKEFHKKLKSKIKKLNQATPHNTDLESQLLRLTKPELTKRYGITGEGINKLTQVQNILQQISAR